MSSARKNKKGGNLSVFSLYGNLWRRYLVPHKFSLIVAVFCGAIAAATAGFGLPMMMAKVFPIVFGEEPLPEFLRPWVEGWAKEDVDGAMLWIVAGTMPLLMLFRGIFAFANTYIINKIGLRVLEKVRLEVFARLQELPLAYHDRVGRGESLSCVIYYTQSMQSGLLGVTNDLVIQPLTLLGALGFLLYQALSDSGTSMLLVNILVAGLCVPTIRYVGRRMIRRMEAMLVGMGTLTSTVQQNLAAQRDVRAFCLEEQQSGLFRSQVKTLLDAIFKLTAWQEVLTPALEIVSVIALSFSLYMGVSYGLSLAQFTAIALALYYCYEPIKRLGKIHNTLTMTGVAMRGVDAVLEAPDELSDPANPVAVKRIRGEIEFENVDFCYTAENPVLRGINVHVPAGQTVALVGPSGSGKTTFINLVCRFYDACAGTIKIDGTNVKNFAKKTRMGAIGLVSQSPIMFRGSVRENIRIGNPSATDATVEAAGKSAFVDEFVRERKEGYDRLIGEGGEGLSGGQRQRIAIARAFLKDAPILILDEATASLDMLSEEKIQNSLDSLMAQRTTFIIAHRFSTIRKADRILVFESGKIVGDGTHQELYENSALYRHLYDEQGASAPKKEGA